MVGTIEGTCIINNRQRIPPDKLGAAHSKLGPGLLEVLYKRAMCIELRKRNINFRCEAPFNVPYDTEIIGEY